MIDLILPRRCLACQCTLLPQEDSICLTCLSTLPRVHAELPNNDVERWLFGKIPFQHATSFCYYSTEALYTQAIRQSKYKDQPWLNARLTRIFIQELRMAADSAGIDGWPFDIDTIIPIPLHPWRLLHRGYNQCWPIAEELSRAWGIPIETRCLRKTHHTQSQVGLTSRQRLTNEIGAFSVRRPELLRSRHVLLVDDVLTTGSTMVAAADALLAAVPGIRISILTLSFAKS